MGKQVWKKIGSLIRKGWHLLPRTNPALDENWNYFPTLAAAECGQLGW
jgi:hypothetical protein